MTENEARLAVSLHSICESEGVKYYACGILHMNMPGEPVRNSIILHDMRANSTTQCDYERVSVADWRAPDYFVAHRLEEMEK